MPISAVLSRTLHEALGDEAAADLVDWMQQVDKHRSELRELYELGFARIDSRFSEHRHEQRAETSALRLEMHDGFAAVKIALAESKVATAAVESKIDHRFAELMKWSFLFWSGSFAAMALARWPR
jgi:hypothetical protein